MFDVIAEVVHADTLAEGLLTQIADMDAGRLEAFGGESERSEAREKQGQDRCKGVFHEKPVRQLNSSERKRFPSVWVSIVTLLICLNSNKGTKTLTGLWRAPNIYGKENQRTPRPKQLDGSGTYSRAIEHDP